MSVQIAHFREQGLNCLICEADASSRLNADRARLLAQLTAQARAANLAVDKSALAYMEFGRLNFYGAPDLVRFLSNKGLPRWTHTLNP